MGKPFHDDGEQVVATFGKSAGEDVRIRLTDFKGHALVDARVFIRARSDGLTEAKPTRRGLSLRVDSIDALIEGLVTARNEAEWLGLLEPVSAAAAGGRW